MVVIKGTKELENIDNSTNQENSDKKTKNKKLIIILCIIILLIGVIICLILFNQKEQTNLRDNTKEQVEIITKYINLRASNDVNSNILGKVYKGEIYTILSQDTESKYNWIEIETSDGKHGYISGKEEYVKELNILNKEENIQDRTIKQEEVNINNKTTSTKKKTTSKSIKATSSITTTTKKNESSRNSNESKTNDNLISDDSKNKEDLNKTEESKPVVIDATMEYYCTSPWILINNTCVKIEYSGKQAERKCSFGYVMSEDGTKCIGEERPDKTYTRTPSCVGGSTSDLYAMAAAPYYGCRKGTLVIERTCSMGYSLVTVLGSSKCVWNYTGKETYVSSNCSYSYPVMDSESGQCVNKTVKSASAKYVCPEGYLLNAGKCYK